jgi:adenosylmethionine-8-amino-7-oxononanoate aminotransferase
MDGEDVGGDGHTDIDIRVVAGSILYSCLLNGRKVVDGSAGKWCDEHGI